MTNILKAKTSIKHNWLLERIMRKRSNLEHQKLSRFGLTDSFLLSPNQFTKLLKNTDLTPGEHNKIFGFNEGGGSVLVNLAKSLQEQTGSN